MRLYLIDSFGNSKHQCIIGSQCKSFTISVCLMYFEAPIKFALLVR